MGVFCVCMVDQSGFLSDGAPPGVREFPVQPSTPFAHALSVPSHPLTDSHDDAQTQRSRVTQENPTFILN